MATVAQAPAADVKGLSTLEVTARVKGGLTNVAPNHSSRSLWGIFRSNVLTLFNGIVAGSFVLLLLIGQWQDALFGFAAVGNALIGVVQEFRAKRSLDRLAILNAPRARVRRNGLIEDVDIQDVVLDDVLILRAGDQVPADAALLFAVGLEADESLLTGESAAANKIMGSEVLSGSIIVSGNGEAIVTRVGMDSYVGRLTSEAKRFTLVHSEIRQDLNRFLGWITLALIPIIPIVANSQMQSHGGWQVALSTGAWKDGAIGAIAGIIAMIPLGLVLMSSVAFAVSAVTMARQKVLVQELASVEGLARVDVLCLDKTGTLTVGQLSLDTTHVCAEILPSGWEKVLGWFGADPNANVTARCLNGPFPHDETLKPHAIIPFSSARKWSAISVSTGTPGTGTWVLGAPEFVLDHTPAHKHALDLAGKLASTGQRTLVLAHTVNLPPLNPEDPLLPAGLTAVVLLTFRETLRNDAARTLSFFREEGVELRIISGDDPRTVASIAGSVGIAVDHGFDARQLPEDPVELADVMEHHTVFGRVTPEQKREMVRALQLRGHVVAMTGDGVNDALAMKEADLGIAMDSAAAATKAVARLVLLDGRFDRLPGVVAEGRRVIANIERVSMLFLTKTVYAVLLSVTFGLVLWDFPFLPRQLSVTDGLTIGIPAFFLALMPNSRRYQAGFLRRSLSFAVPAGVVVALCVVAINLYARQTGLDAGASARTGSLLVLAIIGLWVLVVLSRPLDRWRVLIILVMYGALTALLSIPLSVTFLDLVPLAPDHLAASILTGLIGALAVEVLFRYHRHQLTAGSVRNSNPVSSLRRPKSQ
ncbi:Calcium-transporting ATPase [Arthrobacter ulcerisalmonis]|uniref:Calcium-transporting ATPase n=1 Tax=Arthrobacter ulcerisalmonis TaxID=2483813 RepID=A0A3P5XQM3_9MICC|nr:HAD-IC family P-type ATPase [Arthrobacter ulcerisalmonis]VDC31169.1 Calcium-transporting ATPase [Arthrobacter ulcerisalmonis]